METDDFREICRDRADRQFQLAIVSFTLASTFMLAGSSWVLWQGFENVPREALVSPLAYLTYPPLTAMFLAAILAPIGVAAYIKSTTYHGLQRAVLLGGPGEDE